MSDRDDETIPAKLSTDGAGGHTQTQSSGGELRDDEPESMKADKKPATQSFLEFLRQDRAEGSRTVDPTGTYNEYDQPDLLTAEGKPVGPTSAWGWQELCEATRNLLQDMSKPELDEDRQADKQVEGHFKSLEGLFRTSSFDASQRTAASEVHDKLTELLHEWKPKYEAAMKSLPNSTPQSASHVRRSRRDRMMSVASRATSMVRSHSRQSQGDSDRGHAGHSESTAHGLEDSFHGIGSIPELRIETLAIGGQTTNRPESPASALSSGSPVSTRSKTPFELWSRRPSFSMGRRRSSTPGPSHTATYDAHELADTEQSAWKAVSDTVDEMLQTLDGLIKLYQEGKGDSSDQ